LRHLVWLSIERGLSAAVQDDVEAESSGPSDLWSRDADGWTASAVAVNAPGVPRRVSTAGGPMFTLTIEVWSCLFPSLDIGSAASIVGARRTAGRAMR
jgi:hypothetical protein